MSESAASLYAAVYAYMCFDPINSCILPGWFNIRLIILFNRWSFYYRELLAPNGRFLEEGDTLYQPQLATTLEAIAEQGIEYFYNSSFTHELVTELQQVYPGSILTTEDFRRYTAIERHVVSAKFKDYIMLGMPPPACGVVLGLLLNILNGKQQLTID